MFITTKTKTSTTCFGNFSCKICTLLSLDFFHRYLPIFELYYTLFLGQNISLVSSQHRTFMINASLRISNAGWLIITARKGAQKSRCRQRRLARVNISWSHKTSELTQNCRWREMNWNVTSHTPKWNETQDLRMGQRSEIYLRAKKLNERSKWNPNAERLNETRNFQYKETKQSGRCNYEEIEQFCYKPDATMQRTDIGLRDGPRNSDERRLWNTLLQF